MVLASDLVNVYNEGLSSNMGSDLEVNMCNFSLSGYEEDNNEISIFLKIQEYLDPF